MELYTANFTAVAAGGTPPLAGAVVELTDPYGVGQNITLTTDASIALPQGNVTYTIKAAPLGYDLPAVTDGTLQVTDQISNNKVEISFDLTAPATRTIRLHVMTLDSQDVSGATVTPQVLTPAPGSVEPAPSQVTLDSTGIATFTLEQGGEYSFAVALNDYVTETFTYTVGSTDLDKDITLVRDVYTATLEVTNPDATASIIVLVSLAGQTQQPRLIAPGATEMFTQEVNIGTDAAYRVVEFTGKYQEAAGTITSPGTTTAQVVLTEAIPPTPATQQVSFQGFSANEGATVTVKLQGGSETYSAKLNVFGEAYFALPDGTYDYIVKDERYNDVQGTITVNGAAYTETLSLQEKQFTITITVLDGTTNAPITDATIQIDGQNIDASGYTNGTHSYTVQKAGYTPLAGDIMINGKNYAKTVFLTPAP